MADPDRAPAHGLGILDALRQEPYGYEFLQALRWLEAAYADRPRFGEAVRASDEPLRLAQTPSLAFAPSTLSAFEAPGDGTVGRLSTYFFGLFGPQGPLPLHLTEHAQDRARHHDDPTFARFADVFHHRMLALFYRAWANAQPTASFDRPGDDRFGSYVGSLFGLGMASLRDRDAMPDLARLYFAGRLSNQARNPEGLRAMLGAFFDVPVEIDEFVGGWMELPAEALFQLGRSRQAGTLGAGAIVGRRVWGAQHRFSISLGPMGLADYRRFLPGGDSLRRLVPIVRSYAGDELSWDLRLVLRRDEVPGLRLGTSRELGWTTWLAGGAPRTRDADDLRLRPMGPV